MLVLWSQQTPCYGPNKLIFLLPSQRPDHFQMQSREKGPNNENIALKYSTNPAGLVVFVLQLLHSACVD